MLAIAAAGVFAFAYLVNGGAVTVHTHWANTAGITLVGFILLATHLARR